MAWHYQQLLRHILKHFMDEYLDQIHLEFYLILISSKKMGILQISSHIKILLSIKDSL